VTTRSAPRSALVLGRGATGLEPSIRSADTVIVIAIGWPLLPAQVHAVDAVRERARTAGIVFDAYLVASAHEVGSLLEVDDAITIDASRREEKKIRKSFGSAQRS
jgi:hypothetical protein